MYKHIYHVHCIYVCSVKAMKTHTSNKTIEKGIQFKRNIVKHDNNKIKKKRKT